MKPVNYEKPEIIVLPTASEAVQSNDKGMGSFDTQPSVGAYEVNE